MFKKRVISGPYFPVFGLNREIYVVNFCIQSEYRKIRTRNNSIFGLFSRSEPSKKKFPENGGGRKSKAPGVREAEASLRDASQSKSFDQNTSRFTLIGSNNNQTQSPKNR